MRPMTLSITFDDGLLAQAKVAAPILEKFGWRGVFTIPTEILSTRRLTPTQVKDLCLEGNEDKLMTWDDVRELMAHGHTIAPHTCSHADLPTLFREGRRDEIEREIVESKAQLAAETGVAPKFFCLPHSQHNPWIDARIRANGMEPINGGGCWRPNVGEYAPDGESYSDIGGFLRHCYYLGYPHLDIVAHGIVRAEGGWHPFEDAADFERFCRDIQAEVAAGRVKVVDYPAAHESPQHWRALKRAKWWLHLKLRQSWFRLIRGGRKYA